MKTTLTRSIHEQLLLPTWVHDRVLSANLRLNNYVVNAVAVQPGLEAVFEVSNENLVALRSDYDQAAKVFSTPFLAYLPTLETVNDWRAFVDGRTPTATMDRLIASLPELSIVERQGLEQENRTYINALYDVLNMSVVAAPLLGISNEVAEFLRSIPQYRLDAAISNLLLPLFKWRFADELFWMETLNKRLSRDLVAHYIMAASPLRLDRIEHSEPWTVFRAERFISDALFEGFLYFGCRAKSVSALFPNSLDDARKAYTRLHGKPSPSGKPPSSLIWYLNSPGRRVESTFQTWLFRSALSCEVSIPESFLATLDVGRAFYGDDSSVPPERALHLARTMSINEDLATRPCRTCGTPYLASNSSEKIELAQSFVCPCCNGSLTSPRSGPRRRS